MLIDKKRGDKPQAGAGKPNRLINEKSPYLQQHAYNPVDWFPWGEEALALAKKSDKPIFLSIGYSTCHWCHVMEHESFEDAVTAELMNQHFVNIKVDREERPDLDAIYMAAVQALTGGGGWPMSVWLTPELKPFYGGTYFPPDDRYGRPGFKSVLTQLAALYRNEKEKIAEASKEITAAIEQNLKATTVAAGDTRLPSAAFVYNSAFQMISAAYDPADGGFGPAPKFPMPTYMAFLLNYYHQTKVPKALEMVRHTLERMAKGGLADQLGGGFARYSTDSKWVVPHFEKMLYDNAQLLSVIASLYQITKDPFFENLARRTAAYVLRDLRSPGGAFHSAEDADSEGKEGTFYLWTMYEIKKILPSELSAPFLFRYGVTETGNFLDPHSGELGKNILVQARSTAETAERFGVEHAEIEKRLAEAEKVLLEERSKRVRPHLDDKILTEWNGLMISALSAAGRALAEPEFTRAAEEAATFLLNNLVDPNENRLYRRWRDGERKIPAQQTDYAMFVQALLDLFESTGRPDWLEAAARFHEEQDLLFFDSPNGGYFMNVERNDLIFRMKDDGDNVIPSGNSVAVKNALRLSHLLDRNDFRERAMKTLSLFAKTLEQRPLYLSTMITALALLEAGPNHIVILGPFERTDTAELLRAVHARYLPTTAVIPVAPESTQMKLAKMLRFVNAIKMVDGRASAYVCVNFACNSPTTRIDELNAQIEKEK